MGAGDSTWHEDAMAPAEWVESRESGLLPRLGGSIEAELVRNFHQLPLFVPFALGIGIIAWFSGGNAALWPVLAAAAILIAAAQWLEQGCLRRTALMAFPLLVVFVSDSKLILIKS